MGRIKIALVGIGNCASSLLQGLSFYRHVDGRSPPVVGLMHNTMGGYLVGDIEPVAAFDVNANKIGTDLAQAIFAAPNCSRRFADVPDTGVLVSPGGVFDGVAPHMRDDFPIEEEPGSVVQRLIDSDADICVSFLPVGSRSATEFYADACIRARVALINGVPEFIASDPAWVQRFEAAGLPCAGDDIQSQVGATVLHRTLVSLIRERGHSVENSYQLDIGGNSDFNNLTDRSRLKSKRVSKTEPVITEAGTSDIRVVPADYIPFLRDKKIAYINVTGHQFGMFPFEIELKLTVEDSPNNAGVMVDAIRSMKMSLDRGLTGYQSWSAYFFKHPLHLTPLRQAREIVEQFLSGEH